MRNFIRCCVGLLLSITVSWADNLSQTARWYDYQQEAWPESTKDVKTWEQSLAPVAPGRTGKSFWVVMPIADADQDQTRVLMPYSSVAEHIESRLLNSQGMVQTRMTGESHAGTFAFNYGQSFDALESGQMLVIQVSGEYRYAPLKFKWLSLADFQSQHRFKLVMTGLCLGGGIALALYNLFVSFGSRSRTELYYALFTLGWVFGWASVMQVPKDLGVLSSSAFHWVGFLVLPLFNGLFFIHFLDLRRHLPKLANWAIWVGAVCMATIPLAMLKPALGVHLATFFTGITMVLGVTAGIIRLRQGFRLALYFLLAYAALLLPNMLNNLVNLGILFMPGFDNYQAGLAGTFADAVLLSLAMSLKIRQILHENQLLSSQLEVEVDNRTQELADATLRLEVANAELKKLADSDPLTGLANRRSMEKALRHEYDRFLRRKRPFTMLVIDLDDFKTVNDRHGHDVGDRVLKVAAGLMESVLRNEDKVFRLGGEEFCLLALDTDEDQAHALAERIRQTLEHSDVEIGGDRIRLTASIGGATFHEHMAIDDLFRVADEAMYRAKHSGKNRVEFAVR